MIEPTTDDRRQTTDDLLKHQDAKAPGFSRVTESSSPVAGRRSSNWLSWLGRLLLALIVAISLAFLTLPLLALLMQVPFGTLLSYLTEPVVLNALRISLISSLTSLALMIIFGTPVAYLLGRYNFRGKSVVETLIELPLVLPPAVAGVALLLAFGRRTPIGTFLHSANLDIAFTLVAVVLAQTFVSAPFYIRSARAGFQTVPRDLMEMCQTQGANALQVFRYVVLPLALPGVVGGMVLAWARAVGEFGATILFAGNFQGTTQTMPLAIYTALESDVNAAIVISSILVVASFALLITFKLFSSKHVDVVGLGE
jgi:molybdate transport system permease protein